ncbi:Uncharacterised protein [Mycobacteroides abscessus subsp. massiliense]|nr:Uncharacterised protein [Mycobacteroides abscessus subsp. massiliense]
MKLSDCRNKTDRGCGFNVRWQFFAVQQGGGFTVCAFVCFNGLGFAEMVKPNQYAVTVGQGIELLGKRIRQPSGQHFRIHQYTDVFVPLLMIFFCQT